MMSSRRSDNNNIDVAALATLPPVLSLFIALALILIKKPLHGKPQHKHASTDRKE